MFIVKHGIRLANFLETSWNGSDELMKDTSVFKRY